MVHQDHGQFLLCSSSGLLEPLFYIGIVGKEGVTSGSYL